MVENEEDVLLPRFWNEAIFRYAKGTHAKWSTFERNLSSDKTSDYKLGVRLYNIMGEARVLSTPFDLSYNEAAPDVAFLRDLKPVFGWSHGDGIVPR